MDIIPQNSGDVNIYLDIAVRKSRKLQQRAKRRADDKLPPMQRWSLHKRDAVRVSDRLMQLGWYRRAFRMRSCAQRIEGYRCNDCGNLIVTKTHYCRDRLCPVCNWRLSIKRYGQMTQLMTALYNAYPDCMYGLVTLTCRNCDPDKLSETLAAMQRAWAGVRQQRWARRDLVGWARSIEITYNPISHQLHPHYHLIVMAYDRRTYGLVIDEWVDQARKQGLVVSYSAQSCDDIVQQHEEGASLAGAICEVYKYMVKSSDELDMPLRVFRAFAEGVRGARLVSFGGKIKEYARLLQLEDMDNNTEADDSGDVEICGRCKSQALDSIVMEWSMSNNTYLAFGGGVNVYVDDRVYHGDDRGDLVALMEQLRDKVVTLDADSVD